MLWPFSKLILSLITLSVVVYLIFSQLVLRHHPDSGKYLITVEQLLTSEEGSATIQAININDLAIPIHLKKQLEKGQTIALRHNEASIYYYRINAAGILFEIGPVNIEKSQQGTLTLLVVAFYLGLILVVLTLIWPVFRDLHLLQYQAISFGKKPQVLPVKLKSTSKIAPLANTMHKMSKQVIQFINMHQSLSQTISHEVRTPIARMRFAINLENKQRESPYLTLIESDLNEIELIATSYLTFSRIDYLQDKQFSSFASEPFIKDIINGFTLCTTQCIISYQCQSENLFGDKQALKIVFQNLIANALRYAKKEIRLTLYSNEQSHQLIVEDDGPGLAKNFEPLNKFEQKNSNGYGLGLYIVNQIALWHESKLDAGRSASLGGAKFSMHWES